METSNKEINKKLDTIIKLLENLFILNASDEGMKSDHIRKILGIAKERVNLISKGIKKTK